MNTEIIGILLCFAITLGLTIACILLGKILSIMTHKVLSENK